MKRVHFTAEDLARTRVAPTIGVAAETFDSVRMLRDRDAGPALRGRQASLRGRLGEQAGPLAALMPTRGPLIDAMSLMGAAPSIDGAVDTWMGAPRALLRAELEHIGFHPAHRTWARGLLDGTREARLQVAAALRSCHRVTVTPYWGRVRSHLGEVRAGYVRALAAALVLSAATVSAPAATAAPAAGRSRCPAGSFCVFDGANGTGTTAWFRSGSPDLRGQSMDNRTSSYWKRTGTVFALHDRYGYGGNYRPVWSQNQTNLESVNRAWNDIASSVSRGSCG
ncbi:peptidase inhibitor family I36 protein [Streptomyces californicus]|uniref:peptidase inhibitor family I36 protein n=1 Tax=Streptomyces californicus TaxID=67351 RepID=UPI00381A8EF9